MLLRVENLTKRFPGVVANDRLNLEIAPGEVHALLGENGAGKSTLMNLLYGLLQPDEGQIYWLDRPVGIGSPRDALDLGIGMVHQHFMLVPRLSVLENVTLSLKRKRGENRGSAELRLRELAAAWGTEIDPLRTVDSLSVGERQRVEILKALYRNVRLLILDEPTAALAPAETESLFRMGRSLVAGGGSVIFITHRLDEVMAFSDRVTVLRNGRNAGTLKTGDATPGALAQLMVGHEVESSAKRPRAGGQSANQPLLEVVEVSTPPGRGGVRLKGVTLDVNAGEIVGIAGVDGNGQTELVEAILGLRPIDRGRVAIDGRESTNRPTRDILRNGIAVIPGDRHAGAIIEDYDLIQNALLGFADRRPWANRGWLQRAEVERTVGEIITQLQIRTSSPFGPMSRMSGGHQQRFVVGRTLLRSPRVLLAVQPTRGLDIDSAELIRAKLLELREAGNGVLLVSMDLEEVMRLSDRVAVIYGGSLIGRASPGYTRNEIGLLMAGISPIPPGGAPP
jgi:simple sugar transport system ATP-binding protein